MIVSYDWPFWWRDLKHDYSWLLESTRITKVPRISGELLQIHDSDGFNRIQYWTFSLTWLYPLLLLVCLLQYKCNNFLQKLDLGLFPQTVSFRFEWSNQNRQIDLVLDRTNQNHRYFPQNCKTSADWPRWSLVQMSLALALVSSLLELLLGA